MESLRRRLSATWLWYAAELFVVAAFGFHLARPYADFDPQRALSGTEVEWVTVSAQWAAQNWQEAGYLPWWQPYLNRGQPAIEEAVGFILNPFSIIPSLLFGATNGIKISIIFYFVLAGIGGWFLAKVLGWSTLPRVLLGILLIYKGNMQAVTSAGYFQLGTVQAYFPWALAATFALVRLPDQRWSLVMLALALALVLFAGNLYYILPVVIMVGLVFLIYLIHVRFQPFAITINRVVLWRMVQAGAVALGLAAVYFLPVFGNRDLIGGHGNYFFRGEPTDVGNVLRQFFYPFVLFVRNTWFQNYFTYITPLWFASVVFIAAPLLVSFVFRVRPQAQNTRLWLVGVGAFILFTQWAIEPNPLVLWVYQVVPLLAQWRVPNRMLTVAAFLLAFLLTLRLNGLWQAINDTTTGRWRAPGVRAMVSALLVAAAVVAVFDLINTRERFAYLRPVIPSFDPCLTWLRETEPGSMLSVWVDDNYLVWPFVEHHVRLAHILGDFDQRGIPPTLYAHDLTNASPPYLLPTTPEDITYWEGQGYQLMPDSPLYYHGQPCLMYKPDTLAYAFSIPLDDLQTAPDPLPPSITTPVTFLGRSPEHIRLLAPSSPDESTVIVAQEIAYPGWTVLVNGVPAQLESVGQLIGVVLPPGGYPLLVDFVYIAPLLRVGGMITLVTALGTILYLLRVDVAIRQPLSQWGVTGYLRRFGQPVRSRLERDRESQRRIVSINHIAIDPKVRKGHAHIVGTTVTVSDVAIARIYHSQDADGIADWYRLSLPQVYAALAYYYDHKAEMDEQIHAQLRHAEALKAKHVGNEGSLLS